MVVSSPRGRHPASQVYDFALETKVRDQAHDSWTRSDALISRRDTDDVFTSGRQKAPIEYFMKDPFEISNNLKLVHDFINVACGSSQNC